MFLRFVLASLVFYRRTNLAVALGVAAATAVLTGALIVGDSMRGSLKELAFDSLGRIDEIIVTDRFFRAELADEIRATEAFKSHYESIAPTLLFPSVTLQTMNTEHPRRATNVLAIGSEESFWQLGSEQIRPQKMPTGSEVVLNEPLAAALGVKVGDELLLKLPKANEVPADSPLGRKEDRVETESGLKVIEIIPAQSLGRFALRPTQALPRNIYLSTEKLQQIVEQTGKVNALLIAGKSKDSPPTAAASAALVDELHPQLADFGIRVDRVELRYPATGDQAKPIYAYTHITSDRMIFSPEARRAVEKALTDQSAQPVLTYLANTIALGDKKTGVPYSTVTAIDSLDATGPVVDAQGQPLKLKDDEIALNTWTANDLGAKIGDTIRLDYFAPETTHGNAVETSASFKLVAILPFTEPVAGFRKRGQRELPPEFEMPPTPANDWHLTPVVEGITDQESIANWNPPFPFEQKRVRTIDDTYWENHRTTPKAFVSYTAGKKLWGSRFGDVTSFRINGNASTDELSTKLLKTLRNHQADLGFAPVRIKAQGLAAASGTTPFDALFLSLSFFIIAAALMLVSLLFKLGIDQRGIQIGTLLSLGWRRRKIARALLWEGIAVSAVGSLLGIAIGVGYAWLMIAGLKTWWVGAITTPFLAMHVTTRSLAIGCLSGIVVSSLTIAWSLRQLRSLTTSALLAGQTEVVYTHKKPRRLLWNIIAIALFLSAAALTTAATMLGGVAQAATFVGGGAALLVALLLVAWNYLRIPASFSLAAVERLSLGRLALGAARRNPSRSTLTIGLMATACFLIVAMSSFTLEPTSAGTGGFDLVATTSQPLFADFSTEEGRNTALHGRAKEVAGATILPLRYRAGDDASCNNLYQATQPRIIGMTTEFVARYDAKNATPFSFTASAAQTEEERHNPWRLLETPRTPDSTSHTIPVIMDDNTAKYSLHHYGGIGEEFTIKYDDGHELRFRVVGLLSNSILQGSLIVGERDFIREFPETSGYRYFLASAPPEQLQTVSDTLADELSDAGFEPQRTVDLLKELLRVQNTYLSTFQTLGALGLLLGTFGLATVQLRSVIERRCELALLQAQGFARGRIARLILTESTLLLVGGLATGIIAALVAVLPHMLFGGASIPLGQLLLMLLVVLVVGLAASLIAVRATFKTDIIAALRGE